uniref:Uncharacterized protein n=1 Tax=viral metagenome TaxID=1070528 RepID=A0A6C0JJP6_9ZZZZ
MLCNCYNTGNCNACKYYKNISDIIITTDLNVIDPATYIRQKTNTSFEITKEECEILERIKESKPNDYSEYKEYLLNSSHFIKYDTRTYIKCPNCDEKMCITITPTNTNDNCCTDYFYKKKHDIRCMYNTVKN